MTTDLRIGTKEHYNGAVVQKSLFARFLALVDFRLFRQHRPGADQSANLFQWVQAPPGKAAEKVAAEAEKKRTFFAGLLTLASTI
jgi:hypothetical protein